MVKILDNSRKRYDTKAAKYQRKCSKEMQSHVNSV